MKNYAYGIGVIAFVVSCVPVVALAEDADVSSTTLKVPSEERVEIEKHVSTSTEKARLIRKEQEILRERAMKMASSSEREPGERVIRKERMILPPGFLSGSTTPVQNLKQLKQTLEKREQEIKVKLASTTPMNKKILERAGKVSVAVHALLASEDMLGKGIGQQVSQIAREVDDSVASTTSVEARLESRGFLSKLFFGGDKKSAEVIAKQAEQNQARIQTITELLSSASTTEEVKATLNAQVQAMQEEQVRLRTVAQAQSKLWGLFSWRF